jgi:hypothetical protein
MTNEYYHGTSKRYLPSILKHGLIPNPCYYPDEQPMPFVFLTFSPVIAKDFARDLILIIKPSEEIEDQFITNLGEYIRVPIIIPPQFIKIFEEEI